MDTTTERLNRLADRLERQGFDSLASEIRNLIRTEDLGTLRQLLAYFDIEAAQ